MTEPRTPKPPMVGTNPGSDPVTLADDVVITDCTIDAWWADQSVDYAELAQCRLQRASLAEGHWHRGRWTDVWIDDTDLANLEFGGGWTRVAIQAARATGLLATQAHWEQVSFTDTVADLLTIRFAALRVVQFADCSLRGADFTGSSLHEVVFRGCDLTGAHFDQAKLQHSQFVDCELSGVTGVSDLRGSTVEPRDMVRFAHTLADAMGITLR